MIYQLRKRRNTLGKIKSQIQVKNLVKCGYSIDEKRGLAHCRKGDMFIAHSKILQNAITKEGLQNSNKKS
jgi:hypothetical protein